VVRVWRWGVCVVAGAHLLEGHVAAEDGFVELHNHQLLPPGSRVFQPLRPEATPCTTISVCHPAVVFSSPSDLTPNHDQSEPVFVYRLVQNPESLSNLALRLLRVFSLPNTVNRRQYAVRWPDKGRVPHARRLAGSIDAGGRPSLALRRGDGAGEGGRHGGVADTLEECVVVDVAVFVGICQLFLQRTPKNPWSAMRLLAAKQRMETRPRQRRSRPGQAVVPPSIHSATQKRVAVSLDSALIGTTQRTTNRFRE